MEFTSLLSSDLCGSLQISSQGPSDRAHGRRVDNTRGRGPGTSPGAADIGFAPRASPSWGFVLESAGPEIHHAPSGGREMAFTVVAHYRCAPADADTVRQRLCPQVRGGVDEDFRLAGDVDVDRGAQAPVARVAREHRTA